MDRAPGPHFEIGRPRRGGALGSQRRGCPYLGKPGRGMPGR